MFVLWKYSFTYKVNVYIIFDYDHDLDHCASVSI